LKSEKDKGVFSQIRGGVFFFGAGRKERALILSFAFCCPANEYF
jgi:hypothetical protein